CSDWCRRPENPARSAAPVETPRMLPRRAVVVEPHCRGRSKPKHCRHPDGRLAESGLPPWPARRGPTGGGRPRSGDRAGPARSERAADLSGPCYEATSWRWSRKISRPNATEAHVTTVVIRRMIRLLIPDLPSADDLLPWLRRIDATHRYTNFGPLQHE